MRLSRTVEKARVSSFLNATHTESSTLVCLSLFFLSSKGKSLDEVFLLLFHAIFFDVLRHRALFP